MGSGAGWVGVEEWPMSTHRVSLAGAELREGEVVEISGDEAHHAARVKRLRAGAEVEICNGEGTIAAARLEGLEKLGKKEGWKLAARVVSVRREGPIRPRVEVLSEAPKGAELETMVDMLSQLGAASWAPLACHRSEVDPRPGKLERLERTASESSKQCGRAWWLTVGERREYAEALRADDGERVVVCHMSGEPYEASGAGAIRLLVGPVGDLTPGELGAARDAGATIASFGPLVMRIQTAVVAAAAVVMDAERRSLE